MLAQHPQHSRATDALDFDQINSDMARAALQLLPVHSPAVAVQPAAIAQGTALRPPCRFETLTVPVHADTDNSNSTSNNSSTSSRSKAEQQQKKQQQQQQAECTVVLDVAHNPPAMLSLAHKLSSTFPGRRFRFVVGLSSDKDAAQCLSTPFSACQGRPESVHFVQAAHPRATPVAQLAERFEQIVREHSDHDADTQSTAAAAATAWRYPWALNAGDDSVRSGVRAALAQAASAVASHTAEQHSSEVVVICGSVFLMADARQELGFDEPQVSAEGISTRITQSLTVLRAPHYQNAAVIFGISHCVCTAQQKPSLLG